jgi:hypothetical protein
MIPPSLARVRIWSEEGTRYGLWLPLFLLWLLIPIVAPLTFLAAGGASLVRALRSREQALNPLRACWYVCAVLWGLRGLRVRAGDGTRHVRIWIV